MEASAALERFIRWVMRDTTYHVTYEAVVERQHEDDTLDLLPDDERVRGNGIARVPIMHGLPGCRVRVKQGSRVMLKFANGDPQKPRASLWQYGQIDEILIGDAPIEAARKGDTVEVILPPMVFVGTVGGAPASGVVSATLPKAIGTIVTGSSKLKVTT